MLPYEIQDQLELNMLNFEWATSSETSSRPLNLEYQPVPQHIVMFCLKMQTKEHKSKSASIIMFFIVWYWLDVTPASENWEASCWNKNAIIHLTLAELLRSLGGLYLQLYC